MPERKDFPAALRGLRESYLAEVEELERRRKPMEGAFGAKGGPKDDPCHDRFAAQLRELLTEFASSAPELSEIRQMLACLFQAPRQAEVPGSAYWMLLAVQGLGLDLIAKLSPGDAALAAAYERDHPRRMRFPVQNQVLRELKRRSKA